MNLWWRSAWKEVLAIGPIWVACCLGVAAAPLWSAFRLDPVALIAYVFGAVAIGAHVMGHEYGHRTLPSLLTQPVRRTTILAIKLAVLAVAILTLTAVASVGTYSPLARFPVHATLDSRVVYLPTLMGLTLAPYLALVSRGTLGGAVFSIAVPGVLLTISDLIGVWTYGTGSPGDIDRFKYDVFPAGTIAACAFAAVALWRRFDRLEVLGDSGGHVSLPGRERSGAAVLHRSKHSPPWLLVTKELRLQQMTFIVAGLYVLSLISLSWFNRPSQFSVPIPWQPLNVLYGSIVSVLIGALASAEERQLGTLEWQSLLPVTRRKQFTVKVAVVLGLSIVCAVLLPATLAFFFVSPYRAAIPHGFFAWMGLASIACALGGLYVSSLTSSGVKAVAIALPVIACAALLVRITNESVWQAIRHGWIDRHWLVDVRLTHGQAQFVLALFVAWVALVLLTLAHRNHWSAEKTIRGASAQAATIAAAIVIGSVAMTVFGFR